MKDLQSNLKNPAVAAALISAVVAVIVAAGTAFWTSLTTTEMQRKKVVLAAQQGALNQIIAVRLQAYPECYRLMSKILKDASGQIVDRKYLENLRTEFDDWDSKNGYILGPDSVNIAFAFRKQLYLVVSKAKSKKQKPDLAKLLSHAAELELSLRSDLGIYGFQLQGPPANLQTPRVKQY